MTCPKDSRENTDLVLDSKPKGLLYYLIQKYKQPQTLMYKTSTLEWWMHFRWTKECVITIFSRAYFKRKNKKPPRATEMGIISTSRREGTWNEPSWTLWPSAMRETNSWGKWLDQAHCWQLGDGLKELICMLLSSPTDSQEAPLDKVTSVSLPLCQLKCKQIKRTTDA